MEEEKIPGGWNTQMEVNNTQYNAGSVERMRRRVNISCGWNSQDISDTKHDRWLV